MVLFLTVIGPAALASTRLPSMRSVHFSINDIDSISTRQAAGEVGFFTAGRRTIGSSRSISQRSTVKRQTLNGERPIDLQV
jgi:hypothetical protein